MKKIHYDVQKQRLVTEQGIFYKGKRMSEVVEASSNQNPTSQFAEHEALSQLEKLVSARQADAYEIVGIHPRDSLQEYDPAPWSCTIYTILYSTTKTAQRKLLSLKRINRYLTSN